MLWILNHRTLMDFEVGQLHAHGFEVFVPKTVPQETGFSSARVDHAWDRFLTIPAEALAKLNAFNFYEREWPADIREIANRCFGTIFVMPYGISTSQALTHFRHRVVFRAYGRDGKNSYARYLVDLHGHAILRQIYSAGERFFFGQGYDQLREIEPPLLAWRAVTFPVGVPKQLYRNAGTWRGLGGRILFLCPHIGFSPYYRAVYESFKARFGHLPHVIMGSQNPAVDNDPAVLGFRPDEEIQALYQECPVMYYPSREPRHLHYTPLEAAIVGMPVVYHRGSLLARLMAPDLAGTVDSEDEAASLVECLLRAPPSERAELAAAQSRMRTILSPASLRAGWREALDSSGMLPHKRTLLSRARQVVEPFLRRGDKPEPRRMAPDEEVPLQYLLDPSQYAEFQAMEEFEVDFSRDELPPFILHTHGLSGAEFWGRWTDRAVLTLRFGRAFSGPVVLELVARAFGPNVEADFMFRAAEQNRHVRFGADWTRAEVYFDAPDAWSTVQISIPHPVQPSAIDKRTIGLGLASLQLRALREARSPGANPVQTELIQEARSDPPPPERTPDSGKPGTLRLGVVGNCQAPLWVQALSLMLPRAEVRLLWDGEGHAAPSIFLDRVAGEVDRVIVMEYSDLSFTPEMQDAIRDRATTVPSVVFPAFHPDITFLKHAGAVVASGQGPGADWNSRIVAWAYLTGRPLRTARELLRDEVFRALGYYGQWEASCAHMRIATTRCGLEFEAWLDRSLSTGVFMHGWIHPRPIAVAALAQQLVERDFAPPAMSAVVAERYMVDPRADYVWPVYPDIALALGVEGSTLFKSGGQVDDFDRFSRKCYDAWKARGLTEAEFGAGMDFADTDRILAPLA